TVTFTVKTALDSVVKVTALGNLDNADDDTILAAVNQANSGLKLTTADVSIKVNDDNKSATLTANPDGNYQGSVTVTFTIKIALDSVVKVTDLGKLNDTDNSTILNAVNQVNSGLNLTNNDVTIAINENKDGATLTATPNGNYKGFVNVTFIVRTQLSSVVTKTNLGPIIKADATTILNAVNQVNSINLNASDVDIQNINNSSATLTSTSSSIYQGSVTVTFTIKIALDSVVKVTDLGPIDKADSATILAEVNSVNDLNLTNNDVTVVTNPDDKSATLTANPDGNYQGSVEVTFTIKATLELVVKVTDLGNLDPVNDETILDAVNAKNTNVSLKASDVTIAIDTDNKSATLTSTSSSIYQGSVTVTFTIKIALDSVVKVTDLGKLNEANNTTILAAVNAANKGLNLTTNDVTIIINVTQDGANLTATETSIYKDSVSVTFNIRTQLSSVVTNLNLGNIDNNSEATILNAVNAANGLKLTTADVSIKVNDDNKSATLTANPDGNYQGLVTVTFTIKIALDSVVKATDLGKLNDTDSSTILAAVNQVNSGLNLTTSDVTIKVNSNSSATITATETSNYQGSVDVTFIVRTQLSSVVSKTNLGSINKADSTTILVAVNQVNGISLTTSDVDIQIIGNDSATLTATQSSLYQGSVTVTFTIKIALDSVVKVTDLGKLNDADNNTILAAVNQVNSGLNLTTIDVTIKVNSNSSATLTAIETSNYQGSVDVTFIVRTQLSSVVTNLDLGDIDNLTDDIILAAVNAKNPNANLKASDVNIEITGDNEATLTATSTGVYQGSVTVTFTVRTQLSSVVTNRDLGAIDNLTDDIILAAVNAKNPNANLKASDVNIEIIGDNEATLTATQSSIYQGSVTVTFTIKPTLDSIVKVTNLGPIDKADSTNILAAVNVKNPSANLKDTDVTIQIGGSQDKAILTATKESAYEGTVNVTFTIKATLDSIVKVTALGILDNTDDETILNAVNAVNKDFQLTSDEVTIVVNNDKTGATLTANPSSIYQGSVDVTFTIKQDLDTVVVDRNLGYINNNELSTILEAVNLQNPNVNLKETDVTIDVKGENNATLTATQTSNYQGSVDVTFNIREQLDSVITNFELGEIDNTDPATIIAAVNAKNPNANLNVSDVTIVVNSNNTFATLTATKSSIYQGSVNVVFTIKTL
ncbi:hypothetical protein JN01_0749, partial [Entomoplasma freundtii]